MTPVAGLVAVVVALLVVDLLLFARGREPTFRESVAWSIGWFVLGVAVALPLWALDGGDGAVNYVTVYLIERTLSLDNLFVFLLVFGAFAVPHEHRGRLLFWGIALALVMRGLAILVGVELIERFHWIVYVLGMTLLFLAWRILRGTSEEVDPGQGRTAVPVRSALLGLVMSVAAVAAAVTFGANLLHLVHTPRLYGKNWDVAVDLSSRPSRRSGLTASRRGCPASPAGRSAFTARCRSAVARAPLSFPRSG